MTVKRSLKSTRNKRRSPRHSQSKRALQARRNQMTQLTTSLKRCLDHLTRRVKLSHLARKRNKLSQRREPRERDLNRKKARKLSLVVQVRRRS